MAFKDLINEVISYMAVNDKFSYHMLMKAHLSPRKDYGTIGVSLDEYRITIQYDPVFMNSLTDPECIFILRHEVMHLVLHHCDTRQHSDPHRKTLANVAMDLAINTLLPNNALCCCPTYKKDVGKFKAGDRMGCFPEDYGYPKKHSYEQYMDMLERDYPKGDDKSVILTLDDHSGFKDNPAVREEIKNLVSDISKKGLWGDTPGDLQSVILLAQKGEISWRSLIRHEFGKFVKFDREATVRRPSKKYGYPFPGISYNSFTDAAGVYADSSLSVNDVELGKFGRETSELARRIPVHFQMFDTQLAGKSVLIKGKLNTSKIKVSGRGGTNFQCCIDDAIKKQFNKIVIFTDGFASEPDYKSFKGQLLWVVTKGGNPEVRSWRGRKVYLNNED